MFIPIMDKVDIKRKIITDFMVTDNKGYTIGELVRNLMDDLLYLTEVSARVSIGKIMKDMEKEGLVYHKVVPPKKGRFNVRVWYLQDGV